MRRVEETREKYLYCIIESRQEEHFGTMGINGNEVYTINYKDLGAVVSDSSNDSYEILRQGLSHQKVVESVMKKHTLVPMTFGQVSKTKEDVKGFLANNYFELRRMLEKFNDKVELGVKVSWKTDKIMEEIVRSNSKVRLLNRQIKELSPERSYSLKLELGQLVEWLLKVKGDKISGDIFDGLSQLASESKKNLSIEERMILNAAFLVKKDRERLFDKQMNKVEERYSDFVTLRYVLSPPYNFVTIRRN